MSAAQPVRNARVVAFGNQKGGVTKTSTIVNLAAVLSERGYRVLVWDLDVNCACTRLFGVPEGLNIYGTFEVMTGQETAQECIIRPGDLETATLPENVHLIAAHTRLEDVEGALEGKLGPFTKPWEVLRSPVASLKGEYDFVFLDTSPSMTLPTKAAYMAAEYFILTAIPERLAIEGLVNAVRYIEHAWKGGNPNLRLMGVVMNQVPGRPTRLSTALLAEVDKLFGPKRGEFARRYQSYITASTIVPSVQQSGRTLVEAAPDHKVTNQYRALAEEIVARFAALDGQQSKEEGRPPVPAMTEAANG